MTGRPTKYKPEYDEEIITLSVKGMFFYRIAATWGVSYDSLNEWSHKIDSFCQAYACARTIQMANMMDKGLNGLHDKNFNSQCFNVLSSQFMKMAKERELQLNIEGETLSAQAHSVINDLRNGKFSAAEFTQIMSGIATAAKIDEVTELRDKVEKLEEAQ